MKSSNEKVNDFLKDIRTTLPDSVEVVEKIREIFLEGNIEIEEDIKYGGIVFNVSSKLIGGIYLYKEHMSIEFSNGANFSDPEGFLEGKGKLRRHLKITDTSDLKNKDISNSSVFPYHSYPGTNRATRADIRSARDFPVIIAF